MKFFAKPEQLPTHVKTHLMASEHVLAWTRHGEGILVITDKGIIDVGEIDGSRLSWSQILSATWTEPKLVVNLTAPSGKPTLETWTLDEPGLVPVAVRDRVTATLLIDKAVEVDEVGKVRFIAHRTSDAVLWTTITDDSEAANSTTGKAKVSEALKNLRSTLGV